MEMCQVIPNTVKQAEWTAICYMENTTSTQNPGYVLSEYTVIQKSSWLLAYLHVEKLVDSHHLFDIITLWHYAVYRIAAWDISNPL